MHKQGYICTKGKVYTGGDERKLRNTYAWESKSKEIRARANYLCEYCRTQGVYTYNGLEVHHIIKVRNDKQRLLDNYNLVCLCVKCHKKADRGQIDTEILLELAREREEK